MTNRPGTSIGVLAAGVFLLLLAQPSGTAPVFEHDVAQTQVAEYYLPPDSNGCYYNFQHYNEGDRITTNEPCLNCTCHNRMLMCYLRVCPFTKAIGQDCTIEKKPDQCCPTITCPEVPVEVVTSSTTTVAPVSRSTTGIDGYHTRYVNCSKALGPLDNYGCTIDATFYTDGTQVPGNPNKPCELCYCIRNKTACVMQECTLHVEGCTPVYEEGVCCPVRYDCNCEEAPALLPTEPPQTTYRPTTPGLILPITPGPLDCKHDGEMVADGARIVTDKPCEHCYCMRGDIVCAVQECGKPLEKEGKNCTALPPAPGQCCPEQYQCESDRPQSSMDRQNRKHENENENGTLPFEIMSHKEEKTTVNPLHETVTTEQKVSTEGIKIHPETSTNEEQLTQKIKEHMTPPSINTEGTSVTTIQTMEGTAKQPTEKQQLPGSEQQFIQDHTTESENLNRPFRTEVPATEKIMETEEHVPSSTEQLQEHITKSPTEKIEEPSITENPVMQLTTLYKTEGEVSSTGIHTLEHITEPVQGSHTGVAEHGEVHENITETPKVEGPAVTSEEGLEHVTKIEGPTGTGVPSYGQVTEPSKEQAPGISIVPEEEKPTEIKHEEVPHEVTTRPIEQGTEKYGTESPKIELTGVTSEEGLEHVTKLEGTIETKVPTYGQVTEPSKEQTSGISVIPEKEKPTETKMDEIPQEEITQKETSNTTEQGVQEYVTQVPKFEVPAVTSEEGIEHITKVEEPIITEVPSYGQVTEPSKGQAPGVSVVPAEEKPTEIKHEEIPLEASPRPTEQGTEEYGTEAPKVEVPVVTSEEGLEHVTKIEGPTKTEFPTGIKHEEIPHEETQRPIEQGTEAYGTEPQKIELTGFTSEEGIEHVTKKEGPIGTEVPSYGHVTEPSKEQTPGISVEPEKEKPTEIKHEGIPIEVAPPTIEQGTETYGTESPKIEVHGVTSEEGIEHVTKIEGPIGTEVPTEMKHEGIPHEEIPQGTETYGTESPKTELTGVTSEEGLGYVTKIEVPTGTEVPSHGQVTEPSKEQTPGISVEPEKEKPTEIKHEGIPIEVTPHTIEQGTETYGTESPKIEVHGVTSEEGLEHVTKLEGTIETKVPTYGQVTEPSKEQTLGISEVPEKEKPTEIQHEEIPNEVTPRPIEQATEEFSTKSPKIEIPGVTSEEGPIGTGVPSYGQVTEPSKEQAPGISIVPEEEKPTEIKHEEVPHEVTTHPIEQGTEKYGTESPKIELTGVTSEEGLVHVTKLEGTIETKVPTYGQVTEPSKEQTPGISVIPEKEKPTEIKMDEIPQEEITQKETSNTTEQGVQEYVTEVPKFEVPAVTSEEGIEHITRVEEPIITEVPSYGEVTEPSTGQALGVSVVPEEEKPTEIKHEGIPHEEIPQGTETYGTESPKIELTGVTSEESLEHVTKIEGPIGTEGPLYGHVTKPSKGEEPGISVVPEKEKPIEIEHEEIPHEETPHPIEQGTESPKIELTGVTSEESLEHITKIEGPIGTEVPSYGQVTEPSKGEAPGISVVPEKEKPIEIEHEEIPHEETPRPIELGTEAYGTESPKIDLTGVTSEGMEHVTKIEGPIGTEVPSYGQVTEPSKGEAPGISVVPEKEKPIEIEHEEIPHEETPRPIELGTEAYGTESPKIDLTGVTSEGMEHVTKIEGPIGTEVPSYGHVTEPSKGEEPGISVVPEKEKPTEIEHEEIPHEETTRTIEQGTETYGTESPKIELTGATSEESLEHVTKIEGPIGTEGPSYGQVTEPSKGEAPGISVVPEKEKPIEIEHEEIPHEETPRPIEQATEEFGTESPKIDLTGVTSEGMEHVTKIEGPIGTEGPSYGHVTEPSKGEEPGISVVPEKEKPTEIEHEEIPHEETPRPIEQATEEFGTESPKIDLTGVTSEGMEHVTKIEGPIGTEGPSYGHVTEPSKGEEPGISVVPEKEKPTEIEHEEIPHEETTRTIEQGTETYGTESPKIELTGATSEESLEHVTKIEGPIGTEGPSYGQVTEPSKGEAPGISIGPEKEKPTGIQHEEIPLEVTPHPIEQATEEFGTESPKIEIPGVTSEEGLGHVTMIEGPISTEVPSYGKVTEPSKEQAPGISVVPEEEKPTEIKYEETPHEETPRPIGQGTETYGTESPKIELTGVTSGEGMEHVTKKEGLIGTEVPSYGQVTELPFGTEQPIRKPSLEVVQGGAGENEYGGLEHVTKPIKSEEPINTEFTISEEAPGFTTIPGYFYPHPPHGTEFPSQGPVGISSTTTQHQHGIVPGEGNCLLEGVTYKNNSAIPVANVCQESCHCVSSIIQCDHIKCQPPPQNFTNCTPVQRTNECCPTYICDENKKVELQMENQVKEKITTQIPLSPTTEEHPKVTPAEYTEKPHESINITQATSALSEAHVPGVLSTETPGVPIEEEKPGTTIHEGEGAQQTTEAARVEVTPTFTEAETLAPGAPQTEAPEITKVEEIPSVTIPEVAIQTTEGAKEEVTSVPTEAHVPGVLSTETPGVPIEEGKPGTTIHEGEGAQQTTEAASVEVTPTFTEAETLAPGAPQTKAPEITKVEEIPSVTIPEVAIQTTEGAKEEVTSVPTEAHVPGVLSTETPGVPIEEGKPGTTIHEGEAAQQTTEAARVEVTPTFTEAETLAPGAPQTKAPEITKVEEIPSLTIPEVAIQTTEGAKEEVTSVPTEAHVPGVLSTETPGVPIEEVKPGTTIHEGEGAQQTTEAARVEVTPTFTEAETLAPGAPQTKAPEITKVEEIPSVTIPAVAIQTTEGAKEEVTSVPTEAHVPGVLSTETPGVPMEEGKPGTTIHEGEGAQQTTEAARVEVTPNFTGAETLAPGVPQTEAPEITKVEEIPSVTIPEVAIQTTEGAKEEVTSAPTEAHVPGVLSTETPGIPIEEGKPGITIHEGEGAQQTTEAARVEVTPTFTGAETLAPGVPQTEAPEITKVEEIPSVTIPEVAIQTTEGAQEEATSVPIEAHVPGVLSTETPGVPIEEGKPGTTIHEGEGAQQTTEAARVEVTPTFTEAETLAPSAHHTEAPENTKVEEIPSVTIPEVAIQTTEGAQEEATSAPTEAHVPGVLSTETPGVPIEEGKPGITIHEGEGAQQTTEAARVEVTPTFTEAETLAPSAHHTEAPEITKVEEIPSVTIPEVAIQTTEGAQEEATSVPIEAHVPGVLSTETPGVPIEEGKPGTIIHESEGAQQTTEAARVEVTPTFTETETLAPSAHHTEAPEITKVEEIPSVTIPEVTIQTTEGAKEEATSVPTEAHVPGVLSTETPGVPIEEGKPGITIHEGEGAQQTTEAARVEVTPTFAEAETLAPSAHHTEAPEITKVEEIPSVTIPEVAIQTTEGAKEEATSVPIEAHVPGVLSTETPGIPIEEGKPGTIIHEGEGAQQTTEAVRVEVTPTFAEAETLAPGAPQTEAPEITKVEEIPSVTIPEVAIQTTEGAKEEVTSAPTEAHLPGVLSTETPGVPIEEGKPGTTIHEGEGAQQTTEAVRVEVTPTFAEAETLAPGAPQTEAPEITKVEEIPSVTIPEVAIQTTEGAKEEVTSAPTEAHLPGVLSTETPGVPIEEGKPGTTIHEGEGAQQTTEAASVEVTPTFTEAETLAPGALQTEAPEITKVEEISSVTFPGGPGTEIGIMQVTPAIIEEQETIEPLTEAPATSMGEETPGQITISPQYPTEKETAGQTPGAIQTELPQYITEFRGEITTTEIQMEVLEHVTLSSGKETPHTNEIPHEHEMTEVSNASPHTEVLQPVTENLKEVSSAETETMSHEYIPEEGKAEMTTGATFTERPEHVTHVSGFGVTSVEIKSETPEVGKEETTKAEFVTLVSEHVTVPLVQETTPGAPTKTPEHITEQSTEIGGVAFGAQVTQGSFNLSQGQEQEKVTEAAKQPEFVQGEMQTSQEGMGLEHVTQSVVRQTSPTTEGIEHITAIKEHVSPTGNVSSVVSMQEEQFPMQFPEQIHMEPFEHISTSTPVVFSTAGFNFTTSSPHFKPVTSQHPTTTEHIQAPYPDHESLIPPSGAYLPPSAGDEYEEEDEQAAFGPGTCRYAGKVYVSAQQIPRDDPCDFCFCFRGDIICLQQSCPPPIPGCREEPIEGFCCPRYECPVSMATVMNMSTTTTTTTTTLPPHFFTHAYKGAARRTGCLVQGKGHRVGDIVQSASGPCLLCRCGGDGQMQCEPQVCNPQPMIKKMILAAASRRR